MESSSSSSPLRSVGDVGGGGGIARLLSQAKKEVASHDASDARTGTTPRRVASSHSHAAPAHVGGAAGVSSPTGVVGVACGSDANSTTLTTPPRRTHTEHTNTTPSSLPRIHNTQSQQQHGQTTSMYKNSSTASIASTHSAAPFGLHVSRASLTHLHAEDDSQHERQYLSHSQSMPAHAIHSPMSPSASGAALVRSPRRRPAAAGGVSSRLYTSQSQLSLHFESMRTLVPFVPRALTPLAPHGALVSQWLAMLAWEQDEGEIGRAQASRISAMSDALRVECIRHVDELREEVVKDEARKARAVALQAERAQRLVQLAADAAAAGASSSRKRAPVRFGGHLPDASAGVQTMTVPSTLFIPPTHTAFVCDLLERASSEFGRLAPVVRRLVRMLFASTYQGYEPPSPNEDDTAHAWLRRETDQKEVAAVLQETEEKTNRMRQQRRAGGGGDGDARSPTRKNTDDATTTAHIHAGASTDAAASSSPSSPLSLDVLPYFHVCHLLNLEYHKGQALIESYVDTQQTMRVQGLKRADILDGAVRRMQTTLYFHVFQRWRHVARERRRQWRAHSNLVTRVRTSSSHILTHFLRWRQLAQTARHAKDREAHEAATVTLAALQVRASEARKAHANAQSELKAKKELATYLSRETSDVERSLHWVELQQASVRGVPLNHLLDASCELLLEGLDSLARELEQARQANLQDPLRLLHPTRTTWEWDTVYHEHEVGSAEWALLRLREVEAARTFFDGSDVPHESGLAYTSAAEANMAAASPTMTGTDTPPRVRSPLPGTRRKAAMSVPPSESPSASLASSAASSSSSRYMEEVEILLLWFNFHLVQSQRKILAARHAKQAEARRRGVAPPTKTNDEDDDAFTREMEWFDGSTPTPLSRVDDALASKRHRSDLQQGRAALSLHLDSAAIGLFGSDAEAAAGSSASGGGSNDPDAGLRSRSYFIAQFTSLDALARRVENLTTSLQDSELMLRLLGEIAPSVADMDLLTHIDLGARARLLIRMVEKLNPDLGGLVTSLDFVHAFNTDRVAALLARLMLDRPLMPAQGAWFDASDYQNRTRRPFLEGTSATRLAEQMRGGSVGAAAAAALDTEYGVDAKEGTDDATEEDFGPLAQLSHEVTQLRHALQTRALRPVSQMADLAATLHTVLEGGRRVLDDAYRRDDLWRATRTRLKSFVTDVLVSHARGRSVKLEDPRAFKERELFCALLEHPMDLVWRRQREAAEKTRRTAATLSQTSEQVRAMQTALERLKESSSEEAEDSCAGLHFPHGKPQARFLDLLAPENRTFHDHASSNTTTSASGRHVAGHRSITNMPFRRRSNTARDSVDELDHAVADVNADGGGGNDRGTMQVMQIAITPSEGRSSNSLTPTTSGLATTTTSRPDSTTATDTPMHVLSFELHVIQTLLRLFYEPLRHIWKSYAQADASAASGIAASTTMNLVEFQQLVRDCGLSSPSTLTLKQVEQAFLEVFMSAAERRGDKATMSLNGQMRVFHELVLDPTTGAVLPPKDKDKLELSEEDFVELLVRVAFLRKVRTRDEKQAVVAEWRVFQAERVKEVERERERVRQAESAAASGDARRASLQTPAGEQILAIADPLATIGRRTSFGASVHDSLSAFVATPGGTDAAAHLDETYGIDFDSDSIGHLNLGLSLRFFGLLKLRILPKANKLDADAFRAQYKTAGVSKLFRRHGAALRRLFVKYATLHSVAVSVVDGLQADSWSNTIDYEEFVTMLRDLHLLADGASGLGGKDAPKMLLTHDQCYAIFANVQQELHVANSAVVNTQVAKKTTWGPDATAEEERQKAKERDKKRSDKKKAIMANKSRRQTTSKPSSLSNTGTFAAVAAEAQHTTSTTSGSGKKKTPTSKKSGKRATQKKDASARGSLIVTPDVDDATVDTTAVTQTADATDAEPHPSDDSAPVGAESTLVKSDSAAVLSMSRVFSSDEEDDSDESNEDDEDGEADADDAEADADVDASGADARSHASSRHSHRRSSVSSRVSFASTGVESAADDVEPVAKPRSESAATSDDPAPSSSIVSDDEQPHVEPAPQPSATMTAAARRRRTLSPEKASSPDRRAKSTTRISVLPSARSPSSPLVPPAAAAAAALSTHPSENTEMIYPEFLESLAAIALHRYPNPYKPIAERIETFLDTDVLPFVGRLVRRNHHGEEQ